MNRHVEKNNPAHMEKSFEDKGAGAASLFFNSKTGHSILLTGYQPSNSLTKGIKEYLGQNNLFLWTKQSILKMKESP